MSYDNRTELDTLKDIHDALLEISSQMRELADRIVASRAWPSEEANPARAFNEREETTNESDGNRIPASHDQKRMAL
jgi:hypothetical protein